MTVRAQLSDSLRTRLAELALTQRDVDKAVAWARSTAAKTRHKKTVAKKSPSRT